MFVSTSLSSLFSSDIITHTHTFKLTNNIRVLHTHTHTCEHLLYNHFLAIIELIKNIKFLFMSYFSGLRCLYEFVLYPCGTNTRSFTFRGTSEPPQSLKLVCILKDIFKVFKISIIFFFLHC